MRRRIFALAVPAGLVGLVACTSEGSQSEQTPGPTDADPAAGDAPAAPEPPDTPIDPTPTVDGTQAETVVGTDLRLPLEMTIMIVVKPGWTAPALQLDGMFLGYGEQDHALRYVAMGQDGTTLWTAQRPLSCTGFALSRTSEDRTVAVLADVVAGNGDGEKDGDGGGEQDGDGGGDGQVATSSVTAYELSTAEQLWGPVEVPGPQIAPGLVFASVGDQPMGSGGERVALSASTGEVAVSEAELDGGRIIAEHLGTILHTEGRSLVAVSAADGSPLWQLDLPAGTDPMAVHVVGEISPDRPLAVIRGLGGGTGSGTGSDSGAEGASDGGAEDASDGAGEGASDGGGDSGSVRGADGVTGLLVDLADGSVVAEGVSAATHDLATDITVVLSRNVVIGLDTSGEEVWRHVDPEPLQLVSAGERLAYAVRPKEGTLVVLDTLQGLMVQPYDADVSGTLGMPELFNAEAATSVRFEDERYLVTTTLDEGFGMRT